MIDSEKTFVPDIYKHVSDVGAWMWYRYNSLNRSSKQVITKMEKLDRYLDKQEEIKTRHKKRKKEKERKERRQSAQAPS